MKNKYEQSQTIYINEYEPVLNLQFNFMLTVILCDIVIFIANHVAIYSANRFNILLSPGLKATILLLECLLILKRTDSLFCRKIEWYASSMKVKFYRFAPVLICHLIAFISINVFDIFHRSRIISTGICLTVFVITFSVKVFVEDYCLTKKSVGAIKTSSNKASYDFLD